MKLKIIDTLKDEDGIYYRVELFNNTRGGKDAEVRLDSSIDKVFCRFIRGKGMLVSNTPEHQYIDVKPDDVLGYFYRVRLWVDDNTDAKHGRVEAFTRYPLVVNSNKPPCLLYVLSPIGKISSVVGVGVGVTGDKVKRYG